jgi:molybdopterin synthase sulfur carrier subunit
VEVCFYATLRPIVGARSVELSLPADATVQQLLEELARRWPALAAELFTDEGALSRRVNVYVDGRSVRWLPDGVATPLAAAERVDVFPPVAGG